MTAGNLSIDILEVVGRDVWPLFAPHHYLTTKYAGHGAFMAVMPDGEPVAFTSFIAFPHGKIKNAKRGHRTVVLPDFQGLGMGARLSDWMAEELLSRGHRFYSRTSHPRLGAYRDASPRWRSTTKGPTTIKQADIDKMAAAGKSKISANVQSIGRLCWSHEYMGAPPDDRRWVGPPCVMCAGTGQDRYTHPEYGDRCRACDGHGRDAAQESVSATLPPPDPIAVALSTATSYDALVAVYRSAGTAWTDAHTELARTRRAAIEGTS